MLKGFQEFILRGNVLSLAVGVVMGAAFTAVINALVSGILDPLIAAVFGQPDISQVGNFTINGANFSLGSLLNAVLNFVIVAAALYFVVIMPVNHFLDKHKEPADPEPSEDLVVLTQIRDLLQASASEKTLDSADCACAGHSSGRHSEQCAAGNKE